MAVPKRKLSWFERTKILRRKLHEKRLKRKTPYTAEDVKETRFLNVLARGNKAQIWVAKIKFSNGVVKRVAVKRYDEFNPSAQHEFQMWQKLKAIGVNVPAHTAFVKYGNEELLVMDLYARTIWVANPYYPFDRKKKRVSKLQPLNATDSKIGTEGTPVQLKWLDAQTDGIAIDQMGRELALMANHRICSPAVDFWQLIRTREGLKTVCADYELLRVSANPTEFSEIFFSEISQIKKYLSAPAFARFFNAFKEQLNPATLAIVEKLNLL